MKDTDVEAPVDGAKPLPTGPSAAGGSDVTVNDRRGASERRVVTVLFCDIVRSSFLAERLGPEDWAEVMQEAFELFIEPVERYGGSIGRLMGDAILAFFGAPQAHEDDPQRAILAALSIVDSIRPLREQVNRTWNVDLDVRIGINTGSLVVGDFGSRNWFEYTAMGDAINVAAKVQQASAPGVVLVTAATQRLTEPLFEYEEAAPIEIGGTGRQERVFRVVSQRPIAGKLWDVAGLDANLVGRDAELTILRSAFDCLLRGTGKIVFIVGEAGLGKSRLIDEFRSYGHASPRADDVGWLDNRLISYEASLPYGALQSRFRRSFGIERGDSPDAVHEKLSAMLATFPADIPQRGIAVIERALSIGLDGRLPTTSPADTELARQEFRRELHLVTLELLRGWNKGGPLVFISDDQHWSDAASADILQNALQLVEQMPILFICATRPDEGRPIWNLKEYAKSRFPESTVELRLSPLSRDDSATLIAALVDGGDAAAGFRARILEQTAGNPLFVEEIVRSLIGRGLLEPLGSELTRWRPISGINLDAVVMPDSLRSLFQERVDRLDADSRQVLQQASVIGRVFLSSILEDLALDKPALDRALDSLVQGDLIRRTNQEPEQEFEFRHPLILESVYGGISRRRRRDFHRAIAESMERVFAARLDERAGRIGYHYDNADDERGVAWLIRAAHQAQRVYEPDAVEQMVLKAAQLAHRLDLPLPATAHILRGRARELVGDYDAARDEFGLAADRAHDMLDPLTEWEARTSLGMAWAEGNYERAGEAFAESLALARSLGDDALIAHSLNHVGNLKSNLDEPAAGLDLHLEALGIFERLGHAKGKAETTDLIGIAHYLAGDLVSSARDYSEALRLYSTVGDQKGLASSLAMRVICAGSSQSATIEPAELPDKELWETGERSLRIAREIGWQAGEAFALISLANARHHRGDFRRARAYSNAALRVAGNIQHCQWMVAGLVTLGALDLEVGRLRSAREHLERARALAQDLCSEYWMRTSGGLLASTISAVGDIGQAQRLLSTVVDEEYPPRSLARREAWYHRGRVQLAAGDAEGALASVDALKNSTASASGSVGVHVELLRGEALLRLGRRSEAGSVLTEARQRAASLGFKPVLRRIDAAILAARQSGPSIRRTWRGAQFAPVIP